MKKLIILLFMYISTLVFSIDYTGSWQKAAYNTKGTWSIVEKDNEIYVILDEKFRTKRGPDLFILLSPKNFSNVTDKNANNKAYIVGKLDSFKGEKIYKIKDKINITDYKSILIHCIDYSHLWSGADIVDKE